MIVEKVKKNPLRSLAGAAVAISALAIAGQSVLASLNTTLVSDTQNVATGTMKLALSNISPSAGFSQSITGLVPGDTVNRYVALKNEGTVDGINLKLKVAATATTDTLITDNFGGGTTKALTLTVTSCSQAWSGGTCSGTKNVEIPATQLSSLASSITFQSSSTLDKSATKYLQMQIQLPDQNETTENGVFPAKTVQGGSVDLKYTFDLTQRAGTTVNS